MTEPNAFATPTPTPTPPEGGPTGEGENKTLSQLVGDGKKFKSNEDLAIGKIKSDEHVDNLEKEMSDLRAELDKRLTAEETLKKIQEQSNIPAEQTAPMSEDKLAELVRQEMANKSALDTAEANVLTADKALSELYGEKRQDMVAAKAAELGVSVEWMRATAEQSPSALLKVMGVTSEKGTTPKLPSGTVNTESLGHMNSGPKDNTYAYYEALRKTDPRKYFTPEVQNRMLKLAGEDGESFYKK